MHIYICTYVMLLAKKISAFTFTVSDFITEHTVYLLRD